MTFLNYEFFLILFIIPLYFFKFKATKEVVFLFVSFTFVVIALARPIIFSSLISKDKLNIEFVLALDLSKSMLADDIKPNRFEFAKQKAQTLVEKLSSEKLSLLGFSNQSFMVIPITNNYEVFNYLTKNLSIKNVNKNGTNYMKILEASNEILNHKTKKFVVLFTDGAEQKDFEKEIDFAKQNNIVVSVYNIATLKGSAIRYEEELVKDLNENIVVSKLNKSIEKLAFATNGIYSEYSLVQDDLDEVLENIRQNAIKDLKDESFENKNEIFYIPLLFAFLFFMLARFDGLKKYMFKKGF